MVWFRFGIIVLVSRLLRSLVKMANQSDLDNSIASEGNAVTALLAEVSLLISDFQALVKNLQGQLAAQPAAPDFSSEVSTLDARTSAIQAALAAAQAADPGAPAAPAAPAADPASGNMSAGLSGTGDTV